MFWGDQSEARLLRIWLDPIWPVAKFISGFVFTKSVLSLWISPRKNRRTAGLRYSSTYCSTTHACTTVSMIAFLLSCSSHISSQCCSSRVESKTHPYAVTRLSADGLVKYVLLHKCFLLLFWTDEVSRVLASRPCLCMFTFR